MKIDKKYQSIIYLVLFIIFLVCPPIIVTICYELQFKPSLFVNEWYKFLFSVFSFLISFFLIYIFWENRKKNKISESYKVILYIQLKSCLQIINTSIDIQKSSEEKLAIKQISPIIKGLSNLNALISKYTADAFIKSDVYLNTLVYNLENSVFHTIELITQNEYVNLDEQFNSNLEKLKGHFVEFIKQLEEKNG